MRKLAVFNHVTLDGYFVGANGDMTWAHRQDPEWNEFAAQNAGGSGALVFGRITYDMMAGWWPSPAAMQAFPEVADGMNRMPKYVFSKTLSSVSWSNTTLLKGNLPAEVKKLKQQTGPDLVILGSGSIVAQLAPLGLIDEYQIVVNPLALGNGRTLFEGVKERVNLKLSRSRTFGNGNVFVCYEPAA